MSKNFIISTVVALGLALSACSNDSKKDSGGGGGPSAGADISTYQADYPASRGSIYGGWKLDSTTDNGVTVVLNMYLKNGEIRIAAVCTDSKGTSATTSIKSKANITASTLEILEGGTAQENTQGGLHCEASIKTGKFSYKILADDSLSIQGGVGLPRLY